MKKGCPWWEGYPFNRVTPGESKKKKKKKIEKQLSRFQGQIYIKYMKINSEKEKMMDCAKVTQRRRRNEDLNIQNGLRIIMHDQL